MTEHYYDVLGRNICLDDDDIKDLEETLLMATKTEITDGSSEQIAIDVAVEMAKMWLDDFLGNNPEKKPKYGRDKYSIFPELPPRETLEGVGYIYIIRGGGLRKIGLSNNPEVRLNGLQLQSPMPLNLEIAYGPYDYTVARRIEKHVHKYFVDCRTHGEWFDLSDKQKVEVGAVILNYLSQDAKENSNELP